MTSDDKTTARGRIINAFVIVLALLVAATKLLAEGGALSDAAALPGGAASATLTHVLAILSLARTILGARRSSVVGEWVLRRVLGKRIAERFRDAPAVGDLIVSACQGLRARKN